MSSIVRLLRAATAAAVLLVIPAAVIAQQEKPEAPEYVPPPEAKPDLVGWAEAYERAGRPRILVVAAETTSQFAPFTLDAMSKLKDPSGIPSKLRIGFEEVINDPQADIELVDTAALVHAADRLGGTMRDSGGQDIARALGRELTADLAIVIRIVPSQSGHAFTVFFESVSLSRARAGMRFQFDWKGGTDVPNVKANMRQVARKFIDDYIDRNDHPQRITVRFFGLNDPEMIGHAKKVLETLEGAKTVRTRGTGNEASPFGGRTASYTNFEVTFDNGADTDPTTLILGINRAFKRGMDSIVTVRQGEGGNLAIQIDRQLKAEERVTNCEEALAVALGDDGAKFRKRLLELYNSRNQPRIVVLVNRAPTQAERQNAQAAGGNAFGNVDNLIVVAPQGVGINGGGQVTVPDAVKSDFRSPDELEWHARSIERAINERFGVGLLEFTRVINPDTGRAALLAEAAKQSGLMDQGELAQLLKKQNLADIAIFGVGREAPAGVLKYTFTATNLADNTNIAFGDATVADYAFSDQGLQQLADEVVAKLACDLMKSWSPPQTMQIEILGATDLAQSDLINKAIDALVKEYRDTGREPPIERSGSWQFERSQGDGVLRGQITYRVASDDVGHYFSVLSEKLPFKLDWESKQDNKGVLRITPK